MVKKHNVVDKILMLLLSNKTKEFTIRSIAKNTSVDYKTAYMTVKDLIEREIIRAKKAGQTTLCSINRKAFDVDIFRAETIRTENLLKSKDVSVLCSYIKEIKELFFILLIFGSYASGRPKKGSDIDLMLITDDEKIRKKMKDKISLIPLEIHLTAFNPHEFLSMLKTTEFNVGKEAADNNVILFGTEDYYRLLQHA